MPEQPTKTELKYAIALSLIPNIGSVIIKRLLDKFKSAEAVFRAKANELMLVEKIQVKIAKNITNSSFFDDAEAQLQHILKHNIQVLMYGYSNYPQRLVHCYDSPPLLYALGDFNPNAPKTLAIVGTRRATNYGKQFVEKLTAELKNNEIQIISGLAFGIDYEAHKNATENKIENVGILAHGLHTIYPSSHKGLANQMKKCGGVITENLWGAKPDRENFPKRNRIIAGMADGVLIVETGLKGGAMITANLGNSYNKDVFAVPGKIGEPWSSGCNNLIKTNRAHLVESADDILHVLGWGKVKEPKPIQKQLLIDLTASEQEIVDALLKEEKLTLNELVIALNKPISTLTGDLLALELKDVLNCLPGGWYTLN